MNMTPLIRFLISKLDEIKKQQVQEGSEVNPIISEAAMWYEKLRNALEYKEDEVILRAAIERILKRRLLVKGKKAPIAQPLIRELIWAKYFPNNWISDQTIEQVEKSIELYLKFQELLLTHHQLGRGIVNRWVIDLLSTDIARLLRANQDQELVTNFVFQEFKRLVIITDEPQETTDAQVFIAVRRAFVKEDLAMLRYGLFTQYFGELNRKNVAQIAERFLEGYKEINYQLAHPLKDKIYSFVKKHMPPFYILDDVLLKNEGHLKDLMENEDDLTSAIQQTCSARYKDISSKVTRALIRSVIFIFLTKAVFALTFESSFERIIYGQIYWIAIAINTLFSPFLMMLSAFFIRIPDKENTSKIVSLIFEIVRNPEPKLGKPLVLNKNSAKIKTSLAVIYALLWFLALGIVLYFIDLGLSSMDFNPISKLVFVFFLAVVSFMSYRINQTARMYTVRRARQGLGGTLFDFFFIPFIQLGKYLTLGISQVNIFILIFDYLIETPFKEIFAFLEQWLFFLRSQRETIE